MPTGGAKFVVRHNQIFNRTVETHGTESNQRARGVRAVEVYSNTYSGSDRNRFVGKMRSGVILFHDNTITGYWTGLTEFTLQAYRADDVFAPWNQADGVSQWDVNRAILFWNGVSGRQSHRLGQWISLDIESMGWIHDQA